VDGGEGVKIIYGIAVFGILVFLSIGGYYLNRWWNWKFSYQSNVQQEIHRMIKPECLIQR
jgi:hypothetical protein